MSAPVFLAESQDLSHYVAGQFFELDGEEGRHAGVVQRRQVGEALDVVDGAGHRLRCVISSVNQSHLVLEIRESVQEAHDPYEFVLVQALAKGDRDELAIEAATEVGVDGVVPWQADRSIVIWRGARAAKSLARWAATVRSATKQARRARIPFVEQPQDSKRLAQWTREVVQQGGVVIVLHEEATTAVGKIELPAPLSGDAVVRVALIVGPEGGMTEREVDSFVDAGAQLARLGPHVLRTSTAGPVALSVLSHVTGRWV